MYIFGNWTLISNLENYSYWKYCQSKFNELMMNDEKRIVFHNRFKITYVTQYKVGIHQCVYKMDMC